jgi:hypothetical protein
MLILFRSRSLLFLKGLPKKKSSFDGGWRAGYELKPTRQAKRKEADATGPQGGYGIRLACPPIRAKGMPNAFLASFFLYI